MTRLRITPLRLAAAIVVGSLACTGVAYAASLTLSSHQLYAWSQTLAKGTCNQSSTATTEDDTYVQQSAPASTAGASATTLSITSGAVQNYAFLRWDLSGCSLPTTAGADASTLTVFVTNASTHTISAYPVYSSWTSSTLSWSGVSSLSVGTSPSATFTGSAGAHAITVTADVDAAIKAGALYGWELRDNTSGGATTTKIASFNNTTAADRPTLAVSDEK